MSDTEERFIAAAVAPLEGNAEMQVMAGRELRGMMEGRVAEEVLLRDAAAQMEDGKGWRRWAAGVAVAISLLAIGAQLFGLFQQRKVIEGLLDHRYPDDYPASFAKPGATDREKLLLKDDAEALWRSDPENPVYFADYCRSFLRRYRGSSGEFVLGTAKKIDPENGYFVYLVAGQVADGCVEAIRPPRRKKGEPKPVQQWVVKDEGRMQEALNLLRDAVAMPRWDDYRAEISRERFEALASPTDLVDRTGKAYLQSQTSRGWREKLYEIIAAEAERCGRDGDAESLRNLARTWDALARRELDHARGGLLDGLLARLRISGPLENLQDAAGKLGEQELEERFRTLQEDLAKLKEKSQGNASSEARNLQVKQHGSQLAGLSAFEQFSPGEATQIRDDDLKPGRLADYALVDRLMSLACWLILGLACLLCALFRFRGGALTRRLSGSLSGLIRGGDHAWIFGMGILLPLALLLVAGRLTPLGGRDWSSGMHGMTVPVGQWLAALVLMLVLPFLLAKQRLRERGGFLGLGSRTAWVGWGVVILAIAAMIPYGLSIPKDRTEHNFVEMLGGMDFIDLDITEAEGAQRTLLFIATGGVAAGLLWLIGWALRSLFSARERLLERCILGRMVIPCQVAGMVLMAVMAHIHHAEEKYLIGQDKWMEITIESAPESAYEHQVMTSYFESLREALEGRR